MVIFLQTRGDNEDPDVQRVPARPQAVQELHQGPEGQHLQYRESSFDEIGLDIIWS